MRYLILVILLLVGGLAAVWTYAGRSGAPAIIVAAPEKALGRRGTVEVIVDTPGGQLSTLDVALTQKGRSQTLFTLAQPGEGTLRQEGPDRVRVAVPFEAREVEGLESGPARVTVRAARETLYGLRTREGTASRDLQVRLEPPRVGILSLHHFINHGGAEFVVYRATPADAESGVRVGDVRFPGFPGTSAGLTDPAVRIGFFALLHDQDRGAPIELYARDQAGNQTTGAFDYKVFPRPFRRSRIELDDAFLARVVPAILENTPDLKIDPPQTPEETLEAFLVINRDLRAKNAETIKALAAKTAPEMLWREAFLPMGNSKVEASFADHRTYIYKGQDVDQQVHLGFDLAATAAVPVVAANNGRVLFADYLGIYGNCVIVDHGLGVQSLYAHLSSMDVKAGDRVARGQTVGRSGMTGLAGGDHLHFAMLVNGDPVNSVEWWDPHWIEDRVARKLREAGAPASESVALAAQ